MATIDDVVKVSGASRSTVFRFMNGNNVRPEARKAILDAMDKLNYKSDAVYKQQNITIEISTSRNFEGFKGFTDVVQGITQRAAEKGLKLNIARRAGEQIISDYIHWKTNDELKGVIVMGKSIEEEEKEAEMLALKGIPHVFVNRVMEKDNISYVSVDLRKAAKDIVSHLINSGHRSIATIGMSGRLRVDRDKLEGYKDALLESGIKVSDDFYKEMNNTDEWEDYIRKILSGGNKPTAFFGICDSHAMKFTHLAQSMGFKIPEDIAVVGMDDVETAEYFRPSLTTIHIPFKKMGILAIDNLLQLLTDPDVKCIKTIVNHRLVVRESCNCRKQL